MLFRINFVAANLCQEARFQFFVMFILARLLPANPITVATVAQLRGLCSQVISKILS